MPGLQVLDGGDVVSISFEDILKYHGRGSIAGAAQGFKVMERAFPLLSPEGPPDRYGIEVETAFPGPGTRDAFEMVTRAVTGGRYRVAPEIAPEEVPDAPEGKFFFRLRYLDRIVDLAVRAAHVNQEFNALVRKAQRTAEEDERLVALKRDIAERLLASPADEVYDVWTGP